MIEILQELCALRGVAGWEDAVRDYIREKASLLADDIEQDAIGNLLVFKKGAGRRSGPVMLCTHIDESGFKVQQIRDDGTLGIAPVGEITPLCLPGSRVQIGAAGIPGVLAVDQMVRSRPDRSAVPVGRLLLDLGVSEKGAAEKLVAIGDAVTLESGWHTLGNRKIKSRALESRIGCAVLLSLLAEPLPYDTWFAFTTCDAIKIRGSVGRGSSVAVAAIRPRSILFVECRPAYDFTAVEPAERNLTLGGGCAVLLAEKGSAYTRGLRKLVTARAQELDIRWQYPTTFGQVLPSSRTAVPVAGGAASLCFAAPLRYADTANAVTDTDDIESLRDMSRLFISETEHYSD